MMLVDLTSLAHELRTVCLPDTGKQIKRRDVLLFLEAMGLRLHICCHGNW